MTVLPAWRDAAFRLALLGVLVMLLLPAEGVPPGPDDKVSHLLIFAVLALLGAWAGHRLRWLLLGLAAYAVLTEALQAIVTTTRVGDPADVLADLAGLVVGLVLAGLVRRLAR